MIEKTNLFNKWMHLEESLMTLLFWNQSIWQFHMSWDFWWTIELYRPHFRIYLELIFTQNRLMLFGHLQVERCLWCFSWTEYEHKNLPIYFTFRTKESKARSRGRSWWRSMDLTRARCMSSSARFLNQIISYQVG